VAEKAYARLQARRAAEERSSQLEQSTVDLSARLDQFGPTGKGEQGPDVLVVEDDEALLAAMTAYLHSAGLRVQAVDRGRIALAEIARYKREGRESPQVLVVDLRLRDGIGLHVARRAKEWQPGLKVVLLAADHIDEANTPYLDAVVRKPFALPDLLAQVKALGQRAKVTVSGAVQA